MAEMTHRERLEATQELRDVVYCSMIAGELIHFIERNNVKSLEDVHTLLTVAQRIQKRRIGVLKTKLDLWGKR